MGYAREVWDEDDDKPNFERCKEQTWFEMSEESRKAWTVLGWDVNSWNELTGNKFLGTIPLTADMDWKELNPEQQEAAARLGYDEQSWDTDDDPSYAQNHDGSE